MSHPTHSADNRGSPHPSGDTDAALDEGSQPEQSRRTPLNSVRTNVHATPSSAVATAPPTPLTAAHGGNLSGGFPGVPLEGEPGRIWGRVQTPFATNFAATFVNRTPVWTTASHMHAVSAPSIAAGVSQPIHPAIRQYARIAALLYAARIRPSDAPPFARELAHAYPFAQALAVDLSRHASSPRSRRRRRHMTLRRVNIFTVARFTAYTGGILVFLRIWTIVSLALSKSLAMFLATDDVHTLISYLVSEVIDRPHERALYDMILGFFQHHSLFEALSTPVAIADVTVSPSLFIAVLIATPFVAGAICFLIGACIAIACNTVLTFAGGIRLENHDE